MIIPLSEIIRSTGPALDSAWSGMWRGWRAWGIIALTSCALYAGTLGFQLVQMDDENLIVANRAHYESAANPLRLFESSVSGAGFRTFYRPMLDCSFWVDYRTGRGRLDVFRITNIALHGAACLMVFVFLLTAGYRRTIAGPLAVLCAVHPALAQAVAWIPGRNDTLLVIFSLGASIGAIRYARSGGVRRAVLSLAALACALFTKEAGAVAAALMLLSMRAFGGPVRWGRLAVIGCAGAAITSAWLYVRALIAAPVPLILSGPLETGASLLHYLGLAVLPWGCSPVYEPPDLRLWAGALAAAVCCAAGFAAWRRRDNARAVAAGAAWFIMALVPYVSLEMKYHLGHRLYLPLIGLLICAAALWQAGDMRPAVRRWVRFAWVAVIGMLAAQNLESQMAFAGPMSFWQAVLAGSPRSQKAASKCGYLCLEAGYAAQAGAYFRRAATSAPGDRDAVLHMAMFLESTVSRRAAQKYMERNRIDPERTMQRFLFNSASMQALRGRTREALDDFRLAAARFPHVIDFVRGAVRMAEAGGMPDAARGEMEALRRRYANQPARIEYMEKESAEWFAGVMKEFRTRRAQ